MRKQQKRRVVRKKRVKINKVRFCCFILICLISLIGITSGIKYIFQAFAKDELRIENTDASVYTEDQTLWVSKLLEEMDSNYTYETHDFFSESLHISVKESETLETYQLLNSNGEEVLNERYDSSSNQAIRLNALESGLYFLFFDDQPVYMTEELDDLETVWYTVTRNGVSNQVTVQRVEGILAINVEEVTELPEDVYDITVDPGHGGPDGGSTGNGLIEAEEVIKVASYIAERLEEHGLKVQMSRTGNYEPSGDETFDLYNSPYFEKGRVSKVYQYRTKYLISNHMNVVNGEVEGFEIYSSIFTTDTWSGLLASNLKQTGRQASTKRSELVSEGSYKNALTCQALRIYDELFGCTIPDLDSLYMIRETGGRTTFASEMVWRNPELHPVVPNFGAESILIEYAYIDNINDVMRWTENWEAWGEAVVKATLEYLGIEYSTKRV